MEAQLTMMEEDLENFPSEQEQNILLLQKHIKLTEEAIQRHKERISLYQLFSERGKFFLTLMYYHFLFIILGRK